MTFLKYIFKNINIFLGKRKKYYKKIDWGYIPLSEKDKNMLHSFEEGCLKAAEEYKQNNNTKK